MAPREPSPGGRTWCRQCGRCCWDWKGKDPATKCRHLAEDLKTCLIYSRRAEMGHGGCINFPEAHHRQDLPADCGYLVSSNHKE